MTPTEYLNKILAAQTFADDAAELKDIRQRRKEIEAALRKYFDKSTISIRWAGSMAKETMICESYDGDMTCYFPNDEEAAGTTLEEIHKNTVACLSKDYDIEQKASAIRVKDRSTRSTLGFAKDLHIDVVPGRFTDEDKKDVFLHRTTGDKSRLKTNLQVHIDHIKDSGVVPAIRLAKLWNCRNGIGAKTFVLELLVVEQLKKKKHLSVAEQLKTLWAVMRDHPELLAVEDPANPAGNNLTPDLDRVRAILSSVARRTLDSIEHSGWEAVFGPLKEEDEKQKQAALLATAVHVRETGRPTRPWCSGR